MRETCYRCFWPKPLCWCGSIVPMPTRTRFVFLMHPKEFKQEKAATGRLTHLCLPNSAVHMGIAFDDHPDVQALLAAPESYPVLLYPGREAFDLGAAAPAALADFSRTLGARTLVVILLDATWALGRKMLKLSPSLQRLPRIMFTPAAPSRYVIKQQPHEGCLSTLEAVHELLLALDRSALDTYADPAQLLSLFDRMQQFQLRCAADPDRPGYRRRAYSLPAARAKPQGHSGARRTKVFQAPPAATVLPAAPAAPVPCPLDPGEATATAAVVPDC